jgi:hypothetical protein
LRHECSERQVKHAAAPLPPAGRRRGLSPLHHRIAGR